MICRLGDSLNIPTFKLCKVPNKKDLSAPIPPGNSKFGFVDKEVALYLTFVFSFVLFFNLLLLIKALLIN